MDLKLIDKIEIAENKIFKWYSIELADGKKIRITGNHPIYLPKLKCWRRVDELKEGDIVLNIF